MYIKCSDADMDYLYRVLTISGRTDIKKYSSYFHPYPQWHHTSKIKIFHPHGASPRLASLIPHLVVAQGCQYTRSVLPPSGLWNPNTVQTNQAKLIQATKYPMKGGRKPVQFVPWLNPTGLGNSQVTNHYLSHDYTKIQSLVANRIELVKFGPCTKLLSKTSLEKHNYSRVCEYLNGTHERINMN